MVTMIRAHLFPLGILALCLASLLACGKKSPRGILPESHMEDILYDYHLAQATSQVPFDSTALWDRLYLKSILEKHHTSLADFDSSFSWYTRHADKLYKIYVRINERYATASNVTGSSVLQSSFATSTNGRDTLDIWKGDKSRLLSPKPLENKFSFLIKADTSFLPCDRFIWNMKAQYVYSEGRKQAVAVMCVRYEGDSATTVIRSIYENAPLSIELTAGNLPIKSVEGFIYLDEPFCRDVKLLYISHLSLIHYHSTKPTQAPQPTMDQSLIDSTKATTNEAPDPTKRFIDSLQKTLQPKENERAHFKEIDIDEPSHRHPSNPLLERSHPIRSK